MLEPEWANSTQNPKRTSVRIISVRASHFAKTLIENESIVGSTESFLTSHRRAGAATTHIGFNFLSALSAGRDLLVNAMTDDLELLRNYAAQGSDDAFRSVLERHVGLVYSARFGNIAMMVPIKARTGEPRSSMTLPGAAVARSWAMETETRPLASKTTPHRASKALTPSITSPPISGVLLLSQIRQATAIS